MAQNIVNYADNPTGPELLDDYLAKEQENILSSNSGIQRPSYASAGTAWIDTSVTPWLYKIYDGSEDVVFGSINPTTHSFITSGINETNLVHKNEIETITGVKTFQNQALYQSTTSTSEGSYVDFIQSINGARRGTIRTRYNTDGSYEILLGSNGTDASAPEGITVKRSGSTTSTSCPNPTDTTSTTSKQVANAGWVNSVGNNVVHKTGDETITGVKTFNGAVTMTTATVTGTLNIPGGKIWIA